MKMLATSFFSIEPDSSEAGHLAGESLVKHFGAQQLKAALVYSTMNHDLPILLEAIRSTLPKDVLVIGSSGQGVVGDADLTEEGMVVGVMGFGGDALRCASAMEREIQVEPREKGKALARRLKTDLGGEPGAVLVFYDSLCGLDVEALLAGMRSEIQCALVGAGSGQPWGKPIETAQLWGEEVLSHAVVALGLRGPFSTEIGICHGTVPTGIESVVTRADGNQVLEIDDRSAMRVWQEVTGCHDADFTHQSHMAAWALGLETTHTVLGPNGIETKTERVIRGAFGFNLETGAMIVQAAIPEGTKVMMHHRTVEEVLNGTAAMAADLAARLRGRRPWAVLGFECAARTFPFLGPANTLEQHRRLRSQVAPETPWLGMMAWGEIGPCAGKTAFHNYTYPVLVLVDEAAGSAGVAAE